MQLIGQQLCLDESMTFVNIASCADTLRDVPLSQASAEMSWNLRRPITSDFQILEVHFRP